MKIREEALKLMGNGDGKHGWISGFLFNKKKKKKKRLEEYEKGSMRVRVWGEGDNMIQFLWNVLFFFYHRFLVFFFTFSVNLIFCKYYVKLKSILRYFRKD